MFNKDVTLHGKNKCRTPPLFKEQGMELSRQVEERMSNGSRAGPHTHHPLESLSPKIHIADHILQRDVLSSTVSALNNAEAGHF